MRIGDVAAATGVSTRALRYYEEQGLLTSTRSPSRQRHYPEDAIERVRFLQRLYAAGLSSRTIAALLPCVDSPSDDNTEAAFRRMLEERDNLTTHTDELVRARDVLDELIEVNRSYHAARAMA